MKYKKVTVFTPIEILDVYEPESARLHEEMVYDLLSEQIWKNANDSKEISEQHGAMVFYGAVIPRATYLAFSVGFSVLYETESYLFFFLGDYVNEEMITYIKEEYGDMEAKHLGFITYCKNEANIEKPFIRETNLEDVPLMTHYNNVMGDLLNVLHIKKSLLDTEERQKL